MNIKQLKEKISNITDLTGLVDIYIYEVKKLEKKQTQVRISDLDYTLFSRDEQLAWEQLLRENRGNLGNKVIVNEVWVPNIIQKYYLEKAYPQDIISQMNPKTDMILTAGFPEFQYAKTQAMKINHFPIRIVLNPTDKILELIRYVLYTLKFIPSEIIIYEDRPQYFVEYRELIENILWTQVTIMKVEMNGNDGYKSIEEI